MDSDAPLFLNLEQMTVEDYAQYRACIDKHDYYGAVLILDEYCGGKLRRRHWLNYDLAIEQAEAHFEMGREVRRKAQEAAAMANAFVGKPTWAAKP